MIDILRKIIEHKSREVSALVRQRSREELHQAALLTPAPPSFFDALSGPGGPHLIAEVKKASPSKGVIRADFDPVWIAERYEHGGASALSVLTDRDFFQGNIEFIPQIREKVSLPILRKDFIIDAAQIFEARQIGASAILLIAAVLDAGQMAELHHTANALGLDVLVEVHDEEDVAKIENGNCPAKIVGINNRNLRTFEVSLETTERLGAQIREQYLLVSESGIFNNADVARVASAGARAILVGESLMRQPDPGDAARHLLVGTERGLR